jgi:large subunit ribosomal protein L30
MAKKQPKIERFLRVTYVRSAIGYTERQKRTVRALGLTRLHQSVEHADSPAVRGMIVKVSHLVEVEEYDETA